MQTAPESNIINGINVDHVLNLAGNMQQDEEFGMFRFRAHNNWLGGSRSRSEIQGFYAGGRENTDRKLPLIVDADQPAFLAGENTAPNAVEYLLHALSSCLSTTIVAHGSVQGIPLEALQVSVEGLMNARGYFGISDDVKRGYESIRADIKVKTGADADTVHALAMMSPVYEVVSNSVPVELNIVKA